MGGNQFVYLCSCLFSDRKRAEGLKAKIIPAAVQQRLEKQQTNKQTNKQTHLWGCSSYLLKVLPQPF
jgi:hypothetical protein